MKTIIRQVSQNNRVADEFNGSLAWHSEITKEYIEEVGWWLHMRLGYSEGKELSLQEMLNEDNNEDYKDRGCPYQDNDLTFIRSDSILMIKSEIFGDCRTEFTIESICDVLMYHDMCLRTSERLKYVDYFIPLTKEERYELLDEQCRLLKENQKIVEENKRILKEIRLVQQKLYQ
ncbi:hypothetical protein [Stenotrophomonas bentonitica]